MQHLPKPSQYDKVNSKISIKIYFANQLRDYKTGTPLFDFFPNTTQIDYSSPKCSQPYYLKETKDSTYPTVLPDGVKAKSILEYQVGLELHTSLNKIMKSHYMKRVNIIDNVTFFTNTVRRNGVANKTLCTIKFHNNKPYEFIEGKDLRSCKDDEEFLIEMFTKRFPPHFIRMYNPQ